MNKRALDIIAYMENDSGKSSLKDLSVKFKVSVKTIYQDIAVISEFLKKRKIGDVQLEEGVLLLIGEKQMLSAALENLSFQEYILSKEERLTIEALLLLFAGEYVTLAEISDFCAVSRTTVITDLADLNDTLSQENLTVQGYSSHGVKLSGSELAIRRYFLACAAGKKYLLEMFFHQPRDEQKAEILILKDSEKIMLQNLTAEAEQISGNFLTEGSYRALMKYLYFLVQRLRKNHYLNETENNGNSGNSGNNGNNEKEELPEELETFPEVLYQYICQYFDFFKSEAEFQFLCGVTGNLRYLQKNTRRNQNSVRIQTITRKFIEELSGELHIKLYRDYDLFIGLSRHLERIFEEKLTFISEYQEVKTIINQNPEIVGAVEKTIGLIEQMARRKITEAELDFIVIYVYAAIRRLRVQNSDLRVLLICNSGIGTSQLLKSRLTERFAFQVTEVKSSHSLTTRDLAAVDLVISTVDLPFSSEKYIKVSPLLTEEDHIALIRRLDRLPMKREETKDKAVELIAQIRPLVLQYDGLLEKIEKDVKAYFQKKEQMDERSSGLIDFLTLDFLRTGVQAKDWKEAITLAAEPLLQNGCIEKRYVQAMIKNVEENGAYIVIAQGFALAHAGIDDGSLKVALSLTKLEKPVAFGAGFFDPVRYVGVLSAVDEKQHLKPFFELLNLLRLHPFLEELESCETPKQMEEMIKKYERRM